MIHSSDNKPGQGYQGYQGHVSLLQVPSWDESGSYAQKYNSWYGKEVTLTNDAKGNSFKLSNSFKYFKVHFSDNFFTCKINALAVPHALFVQHALAKISEVPHTIYFDQTGFMGIST